MKSMEYYRGSNLIAFNVTFHGYKRLQNWILIFFSEITILEAVIGISLRNPTNNGSTNNGSTNNGSILLYHVKHAVIWRSFVSWAEDDVCSAEVGGRIESFVDAQSLGGPHEADEHTEKATPDVYQFASSPSF